MVRSMALIIPESARFFKSAKAGAIHKIFTEKPYTIWCIVVDILRKMC